MTPLLEAALGYAARGWPVFPCRRDKAPLTQHGVGDATTDPARIREWWARWPEANVAVDAGGAGMLVLDLDPGHDPAALAAALGGRVPETGLRARTPRGGTHLFYRLEPGDPPVPPSASRIAEKVDVRSHHSYVLLAPSATDAGEYRWESEGKPAPRSPALLAAASAAREKHADRDHWLIDADLPENIEAYARWLRTEARAAVQGQGGDHCAYATAAMGKSYGISEEATLALMLEHWNPRCVPPWSGEELAHLAAKVRNGHAYNTSPPGNMTTAYRIARAAEMFRPVTRELGRGTETTAGRFRFVDRAGLAAVADPKWLVEGMLPRGAYALLVGPRASFKSFVALDVALSVARHGVGLGERAAWGGRVVEGGPVLVAVGEGRSGVRRRVEAWEAMHGAGLPTTGLVLGDPVPLVSAGAADLEVFVEGALRASPGGYRLVVIDTVGRAMQGVNENAQEHASNFTRMVEALTRGLGCTVLALHHSGHGEDGRARGSSVFEADADAVFVLRRDEQSRLVTVGNSKQKDAPEWEKPLALALVEQSLADGERSLVAALPTEADRPRRQAEASENRAAALLTVGAAIERVLRSNTLLEHSDKSLADAVEADPLVEIGASMLRQRHFHEIRRTNHPAARHYDVAKRRWRWAGE